MSNRGFASHWEARGYSDAAASNGDILAANADITAAEGETAGLAPSARVLALMSYNRGVLSRLHTDHVRLVGDDEEARAIEEMANSTSEQLRDCLTLADADTRHDTPEVGRVSVIKKETLDRPKLHRMKKPAAQRAMGNRRTQQLKVFGLEFEAPKAETHEHEEPAVQPVPKAVEDKKAKADPHAKGAHAHAA